MDGSDDEASWSGSSNSGMRWEVDLKGLKLTIMQLRDLADFLEIIVK